MTDPRDRQYTNGEITVFWVPSKCIHATTCFRELIEVYNPGRRPWVNMEGASTRRIIEVTNKCPTQALVWKYNKDLTKEEKTGQRTDSREELTPENISGSGASTIIKLMKDGPIVVEGSFSVTGSDSKELKSSIMTSFCRCGSSRNMPYCDGTHRKIDFRDQSEENGE